MKNIINYLVIIPLLMFSLVACQTTSKSNTIKQIKTVKKGCGVTQGSFLGSWFDYYERGLSYADCVMWPESEQDLRKALSKRSVDKRRVYSLGMHLISNYFPHRELGIALFYQKKYAEAEQQFTISLSQFPTSKAEEYLNRIRIINLSISNNDKHPPKIQINLPQSNSIHSTSVIHVEGVVIDDSFIDKVEVNGIDYRHIPSFTSKSGTPIRIERKVSTLNFSLDVPIKIKNGQATIEVIATDISGKKSTRSTIVLIDQQGPQISIQEIKKVDANSINVVLDVQDNLSHIKQLKINNKAYQIKVEKIKDTKEVIQEIHIDEIINGPLDNNTIIVIAVDQSGNETQATLIANKKTRNDTFSQSPMEIFFIKGEEQRTTLEKKAYIEGEIESDSTITKLFVNGTNILNGQAKHVYFNYNPDLRFGKNTFHFVVENKQGQKQQSELTIIRKTSPNRSLNERLKVALFPFPCNSISRAPCNISSGLHDNLNNKLTERKRFQITDQHKINQFLDETRSCESDVDDQCVAKISDQLISQGIWEATFSNALFVGSVIERSNKQWQNSVEISGRILNNETKETLTTVDIYAENLNVNNFKHFSQGLVTELSDAFPLIDSRITHISGDILNLQMSDKDRVWERMPILIYQIADKTSCGNAHLLEVNEQLTKAELDQSMCENINPLQYRAITR